MDLMPIIHCLFDGDSWYNYHDTVLNVTGVSYSKEALIRMFLMLPKNTQQTAFDCGLADTVFNDDVYVVLTKELARTKQV